MCCSMPRSPVARWEGACSLLYATAALSSVLQMQAACELAHASEDQMGRMGCPAARAHPRLKAVFPLCRSTTVLHVRILALSSQSGPGRIEAFCGRRCREPKFARGALCKPFRTCWFFPAANMSLG
ncbi:hypothetical protein CALCODRAFT_153641 [Calocera cornea HHB12733]|uniref:Uncharacterized protein n=1 Tax=Calocera cornea HHB12733 TaxID=1353952 RepID=A0A165CMS4_9BASI|nr:hypothetical protein CALCODRAFT_153641 [Calocera cornea HHB12733]